MAGTRGGVLATWGNFISACYVAETLCSPFFSLSFVLVLIFDFVILCFCVFFFNHNTILLNMKWHIILHIFILKKSTINIMFKKNVVCVHELSSPPKKTQQTNKQTNKQTNIRNTPTHTRTKTRPESRLYHIGLSSNFGFFRPHFCRCHLSKYQTA